MRNYETDFGYVDFNRRGKVTSSTLNKRRNG